MHIFFRVHTLERSLLWFLADEELVWHSGQTYVPSSIKTQVLREIVVYCLIQKSQSYRPTHVHTVSPARWYADRFFLTHLIITVYTHNNKILDEGANKAF